MNGHDERSVRRADTEAAIGLIDRLGMAGRGSAAALTAFERDRILARIYRDAYGDCIDSTLRCAACSSPFDISFTLGEMATRMKPAVQPDENGVCRLDDGTTFRLPTGEDEVAVGHLSADAAVRELLRRCVMDAPSGIHAEAIQDAMESAAPILDFDLNTSCPECGAAAKARFDLQSYLLESIVQDQKRLWREAHILAATYRWGLNEILGLTRAERRTLIGMIDADSARRGLG